MKILLDPQIFHAQRFGGVSRYFAELLYLTPNVDPLSSITCPLPLHTNLHLEEKKLLTPKRYQTLLSRQKFKGSNTLKHLFSNYKRNSLRELKRNRFDVFVPTYYDPYFMDELRKPFVLTVYDMIHEIMPEYFKNAPVVSYKKLLLEAATNVIAISHNTKADILKIYPHIAADKIKVVHLSQSIDLDSVHKRLDGLPDKYLLFVGNRSSYKNFGFFVEAISPLLSSDPRLYLVCAGGGRFEETEISILEDLGISRQVIQRDFRDHELAAYYHHAAAFIFPSRYEGFGIPVLEAMACGCPVVLSAHSSFPEVAGDAGIYFESGNAMDLQRCVAGILRDESRRQESIEVGYRQAKKFTWEKTIAGCLDVFRSAVDGR